MALETEPTTYDSKHGGNVSDSPRPLVSIVVVGYNQAQFIESALSSALEQTYAPKKVIFVDDGSTDNTPAILALHPRVQYLKQPNKGLSAARNAGLAASSGEYVVFLDGDDKLLPSALQSGVKCFTEFPRSAFVFGQYREIDESGTSSPAQRDLGILADYYTHLLHGNFIGMHATVMYSRERLQKSGGFDTRLRAAEDYEIYLRLARDGEIRQHGSLVAEYRRHDRNMSGDATFMLRSVLRVCDMERAHICNPLQAQSVRSGKSFYTRYYGDKMIEAWKRRRDVAGLLALVRWYPLGSLRRAARSLLNRLTPRRNTAIVDFGSLGRRTPISRQFGYERGAPIDRRYIESFLSGHASDIRGVVLEIGDDTYSRRFGEGRVSKHEILSVAKGNPMATIVANLEDAPQIPSGYFDCIVFTQTLNLIYDVRAALATLHRILGDNGTLLMSVPCISQIVHDPTCPNSDSWRFTRSSISRLMAEVFADGSIEVRVYGNVLAASSFLYGIAAQELTAEQLDSCDDDYPVVICVRASKGGAGDERSS